MSNAARILPCVLLWCIVFGRLACAEDSDMRQAAIAAMKSAAQYYHSQLAVHGGYVYYYSADRSQRLGEGAAKPDQIWVQPPGTPTVGMAFLAAYEATGDKYFLDAAVDAARALVFGQLESGGWTATIEFPPSESEFAYRNGKQNGKRNNSSLDDGTTQAALQCLMKVDEALRFEDATIHEAVQVALDGLLNAQFPNGGFPQSWTGPVDKTLPVLRANYPDYDWRTEGRVKAYWDMYTLNDGLAGTVFQTLQEAHRIYADERCRQAIRKLGDFLILAQMPDPQPIWAQQYNYQMQPIWARRFEPAAVTGGESQDVIETLFRIYAFTGESRYLEPIPRALAHLRASVLPDGRLARYYELQTNRPLYMNREGRDYFLTYSDERLPDHYGWKQANRLDELESKLQAPQVGQPLEAARTFKQLEQDAANIIRALDADGRWLATAGDERLTGQPKFPRGTQYISSPLFARNMQRLSDYVKAAQSAER